MRAKYNLEVCDDCAALVANGQVTSAGGDDISAEVAAAQTATWGDDARRLVLGSSSERIPFSRQSCDGCGSDLGGPRTPAHILVED